MTKIRHYPFKLGIEREETTKDGKKHFIDRLGPMSTRILKKTDEMYLDEVGDWYILVEKDESEI